MLRFCIVSMVSLLFISLISCSKQGEYSEFRDIEAKGWNRYDTLRFKFPIHDNQAYDLLIDTRNNSDYPYQNLYLFVSCRLGNSIVFSDTIQTRLADKLGNWTGSGWGSLYTTQSSYKRQFRFPAAHKNYQLQIVQGMRNFDLIGIESVGIHVVPVE